MSVGRLMLSVRDALRLNMELTDDECHVMPDGRPMPSCGQKFIAVYAHSWNASPDDFNASEGLAEWYGVTCAVTFRTAHVPFDRYIPGIGLELEDFCRRIISNVHLSQEILLRTNERIEEELSQSTAMLEQIRWASADPSPQFVTGDWFGEGPPIDNNTGLMTEVRFEQATRIQSGPRSITLSGSRTDTGGATRGRSNPEIHGGELV